MNINKFLMEGRKGDYYVAKKTKDRLNIEPDTEKNLSAKGLIPYGFDINFGGHNYLNFTMGYLHEDYNEFRKKFKGKKDSWERPNPKDFGKENLNRTLKGLEEIAEDRGADYILISKLSSSDMGTFWDIAGSARFLIKTNKD